MALVNKKWNEKFLSNTLDNYYQTLNISLRFFEDTFFTASPSMLNGFAAPC